MINPIYMRIMTSFGCFSSVSPRTANVKAYPTGMMGKCARLARKRPNAQGTRKKEEIPRIAKLTRKMNNCSHVIGEVSSIGFSISGGDVMMSSKHAAKISAKITVAVIKNRKSRVFKLDQSFRIGKLGHQFTKIGR